MQKSADRSARLAVFVLAIFAVSAASNTAHAQNIGDTRVFAPVAAPGMPEGIAVQRGRVYVSTHRSVRGNAGEGPSKIFAYDLATGALERTYTITGQDTTQNHGLLGMAFDADGRLYVLDDSVPARMLRIDPKTGTQKTYATFPDLKPCTQSAAG